MIDCTLSTFIHRCGLLTFSSVGMSWTLMTSRHVASKEESMSTPRQSCFVCFVGRHSRCDYLDSRPGNREA